MPRSRCLTPAEGRTITELFQAEVDGRWLTMVEIAERVGRSRGAVAGFVRRARLVRPTADASGQAERPGRAEVAGAAGESGNRGAGLPVARLVELWRAGCPVDVLAREVGMSAGELWTILEGELRPGTEHGRDGGTRVARNLAPVLDPAVLEPALGRTGTPAGAPARSDCVGPTCPFSCVAHCARTVGGTDGAGRRGPTG